MSKFFSFAVLFAAIALTANAQCGNQCKFRFCKLDGEQPPNLRPKTARILLRGPDSSRTGYICRSFPGGKSLGTVKSTGTAIVSKGGVTRPINQYRPSGLSPKLPKDYFRLYNILFARGLQGVGRKASKGTQEDFLDGLCVVLPITAYDILNADGSVSRSISSTNSKDCISFLTVNKPILVEVAWDSSDDFDLSVEGPDGDGDLVKDQLVNVCGGPPQGKETVTFDNAKPGSYKITLRHFNNCGGTTKFTVNAIVNGVRMLQRKGRSSVDGKTVLEATFNV